MDYGFTTGESIRRADEIVDYMRGPRLWVPRTDYPDYEDWLHRAHAQLRREEKLAVVALSSGRVAGVVLFQGHRGFPGVLEVKNITVRPDLRGRHFASFMLRNAEVEGGRQLGCRQATVDAKAGNEGVRRLLLREGYRPSRTEDLYGLGAGDDVVYSKRIG